MTLPNEIKPMMWGAVIGAVLCAVVGFSWGGWMTGGAAREEARVAGQNAMVAALAPFCAEKFRAQGDAPAKISELIKANSWERSTVLEKAGFAINPGTKAYDSDIGRACVEILMAPPATKK